MDQSKIKSILQSAIDQDASDVHLISDKPPIIRIHGHLKTTELPSIPASEMEELLYNMMNEQQKQLFLSMHELDFSFMCMDNYQFRVNVYKEKLKIAATIRIISSHIGTQEELGLSEGVIKLTKRRKGLIILSGTAGSGKSTTLNFMVDRINSERKCKIITIEDPIEYIHTSKQSLIVQREVGSDTQTFSNALKYSLRQDPDVVVVGEIRDLDSIAMALTTAETGHLVITTVHAPDAIETINRIIDVYPTGMREQICIQMAENLAGVIGQTLVPGKEREERVLITEILIATLPIRNMIRRGALVEIRGQLDAEDGSGMHTYERCLSLAVRKNLISIETAREYAKDPRMLKV